MERWHDVWQKLGFVANSLGYSALSTFREVPPWLLLMHGLFCSLNCASLMDFFLFSHCWCMAGHEWGTELLLVSHFCFKTPFLLSVIIFTIFLENSCHHILSSLALLWHITISYSSSFTEEFDTWSSSSLLIIFCSLQHSWWWLQWSEA